MSVEWHGFEPYWRMMILSNYLIFGHPSYDCISYYFTSSCFRFCISSCISLYINLTLVLVLFSWYSCISLCITPCMTVCITPCINFCINLALVPALVSLLVSYEFMPNSLHYIYINTVHDNLHNSLHNIMNDTLNDILQIMHHILSGINSMGGKSICHKYKMWSVLKWLPFIDQTICTCLSLAFIRYS